MVHPVYLPSVEEINIIQSLDFEGLDSLTAEISERDLWLQKRLGKITASTISRILTYENKKELQSGHFSYIDEKVYERIFKEHFRENYTSDAMLHGIEYEGLAVKKTQEKLNVIFANSVLTSQKFKYKNGIGATPDGILKDHTLQIKCPEFKAHSNYKRIRKPHDLKEINKDIYWQVQTEMLVWNKPKAIFTSFFKKDDFEDLFTVIIPSNSTDQKFIQHRADMANKEIRNAILRYKRNGIR